MHSQLYYLVHFFYQQVKCEVEEWAGGCVWGVYGYVNVHCCSKDGADWCELVCEQNGCLCCTWTQGLQGAGWKEGEVLCGQTLADLTVEFNEKQIQSMYDYAKDKILLGNCLSGSYTNNLLKPDGTIIFRTVYWLYDTTLVNNGYIRVHAKRYTTN